jgi:hypothetical protein
LLHDAENPSPHFIELNNRHVVEKLNKDSDGILGKPYVSSELETPLDKFAVEQ